MGWFSLVALAPTGMKSARVDLNPKRFRSLAHLITTNQLKQTCLKISILRIRRRIRGRWEATKIEQSPWSNFQIRPRFVSRKPCAFRAGSWTLRSYSSRVNSSHPSFTMQPKLAFLRIGCERAPLIVLSFSVGEVLESLCYLALKNSSTKSRMDSLLRYIEWCSIPFDSIMGRSHLRLWTTWGKVFYTFLENTKCFF